MWIVIAIAALLASVSTLSAQTPLGAAAVHIRSEAFELEVIRLTNVERTSRSLPPLQRNSDLTDAARAHNQDMIDNHK